MSNAAMWLGLAEAKFFLECGKRLVEVGPWKRAENRDQRTEKHIFEARIAIDGTLPRGLWFRATVQPRYPDSATFQLDCDRANSRTHHTLYRLDWRPLRAHVNGYHGPEEFHGRLFAAGETHDHTCLDHVVDSQDRIRSGDVQCARPITPDFKNFAEALAYVCDRIHITNGDDIPKPGDQGSLF